MKDIFLFTKAGPVNRGLRLLYKNFNAQASNLQVYYMFWVYIQNFRKNTPKNKISVHNTKLQVMQTRRTLTSSTVMRQLHALHVLTVYPL